MSRYAILFPGQGSQRVGMGADVFAAYPDLLGVAADRIVGWPVESLVTEGPIEELTRTEHAQPALYGVSYALWAALAEALPAAPAAAAGHSLGEYTALAAASVFSYEDGLRLVAERGRAMSDAAASGEPSGMAALIGADLEQAEAVAENRRRDGGKLWVANINAPAQIVLAGSEADIAWVCDHARELGIRRAVPLAVAGAFHSPYMAAAADRLGAALDATRFSPSSFPVYANTTARPVDDPATQLVEQLVRPVRFAETLRQMFDDGITTFIHVGPGDVTAGLVRRTVPEAAVRVVSELGDISVVADDAFIQ
jgi:[acyl-carrier-protein] S-malonyltransferase